MTLAGIFCPLHYSKAERTALNRASSLNGLPRKATAPARSAFSGASWSSCAETKIIGIRLCEAANCVDRNGNFFEKGAQESAFFGDASAGLDSVSPGLGAGSGAIAFRLPFSRL